METQQPKHIQEGKLVKNLLHGQHDINVARRFATESSNNGIILQKNVAENTLIRTQNSIHFGESEVLIKGAVKGAKVIQNVTK